MSEPIPCLVRMDATKLDPSSRAALIGLVQRLVDRMAEAGFDVGARRIRWHEPTGACWVRILVVVAECRATEARHPLRAIGSRFEQEVAAEPATERFAAEVRLEGATHLRARVLDELGPAAREAIERVGSDWPAVRDAQSASNRSEELP